MKALEAVFARTGGPEVIEWREVGMTAPPPDRHC
jgi:hypothetical protein